MAMLSVTTILLLALLASIAFPQFRTALIWLTVAIIVFLAYISDSILQQRFDDQQTTQSNKAVRDSDQLLCRLYKNPFEILAFHTESNQ